MDTNTADTKSSTKTSWYSRLTKPLLIPLTTAAVYFFGGINANAQNDQQTPQQLEQELEKKAKEAYEQAGKLNYEKEREENENLTLEEHFHSLVEKYLAAYELFQKAEAADPSSIKYDLLPCKVSIRTYAASYLDAETDHAKAKALYERVKDFFKDALDSEKEQLTKVIEKHNITYEFNTQDQNNSQQNTNDQKSSESTQCFTPDRIVLEAEPNAKSYTRSFDVRAYGFHLFGLDDSEKYKSTIGEKIEDKLRGGAASIDLSTLKLPVALDFATERHNLKSFSKEYSETDSSQFNIKTATESESETIDEFLAGALRAKISGWNLLLGHYANDQKIDVGVKTSVQVNNKTNPPQSYQQLIPTIQNFANKKTGNQVEAEHALTKDFNLGVIVAQENTEMPDFGRTLDVYRVFFGGNHFSSDNKWGVSGLLGRNTINDNKGGNNENMAYAFIGGAELSDSLTGTLQLVHNEQLSGGLNLLIGKSDNVLKPLLENAVFNAKNTLELNGYLSDAQQELYLRSHNEDIIRTLAQQHQMMFLLQARFANQEKQSTNYNLQGTFLMPINQDITLSLSPYTTRNNEFKESGLRTGIHNVGSPWDIVIDLGSEHLNGRGEGNGFRGIVGLSYNFGRDKK